MVVLAVSLPGRAAELVYYWDFNGDLPAALSPTIGSGGAGILYTGVGAVSLSQGTGTEVNRYESYAAGKSLAFVDLADAFRVNEITFAALDFSLKTDVVMTVAVRSTGFFSALESFTYQYRVSPSDSWSAAVNWAFKPSAEWQVLTLDFSSALNLSSNAQIRLVSTALFDAGEVLQFDNVQITAVPEPGALGLLGVGVLVLTRRRHRRRVAEVD